MIGRAAADALEELGATVTIGDLAAERVEEWRSARAGRRGMVADVTREDDLGRLVAEAAAPSGAIHVLVHSAAVTGQSLGGGWGGQALASQRSDAWDMALRVNLTSAFHLVRAALPALEQSSSGSVVFISSIYGGVGPDLSLYEGTDLVNPAAYGASKGGLNQLTRYLATTLAPGVRVNAVSPGGILRGQPAAFRERYERRAPLARMATEEDMKGAIAYLASDLSAYVTGQNLLVDGGWTTR